MNNDTYAKTVIEFQIAIIKELFKHSRIGKKEYNYSLKKLESKLKNLSIDSGLLPVILDVKI